MTEGYITNDVEMAKHGCDIFDSLTEKIFKDKYAGKKCIIVEAIKLEDSGYDNWKCGTDYVFHCLFDGIKATLCRHQLVIGD
jgi:hypothetical protein